MVSIDRPNAWPDRVAHLVGPVSLRGTHRFPRKPIPDPAHPVPTVHAKGCRYQPEGHQVPEPGPMVEEIRTIAHAVQSTEAKVESVCQERESGELEEHLFLPAAQEAAGCKEQ